MTTATRTSCSSPPPTGPGTPTRPTRRPPPPSLALYRNEGHGKFTDVTAGSGLDIRLYGMGVAVGDYDADGRVDVFISTVGRNRLFRNLGAGRFVDVTDAAGVAGADDAWSSSCAFFDADNDGDLDLFVANYVTWSREIDMQQAFKLTGIGRAYGPPLSFAGSTPYLYRNNGDGTFTEISQSAGLHVKTELGQPMAKSLGVAPYDFDHDGDIDILVANDTVRNFLFQNNGDMNFTEVGRAAGIAYDPNGNARGAMGVDAARFRNDEPSVGIVVGNFANEMTALYVSAGSALKFTDDANVTGLGPPTRLALTFGVVFADLDLDARLDIVAANGHVEDEINKVQSSQHHAQPAQLFWNAGLAGSTEFIPLDESHCGGDILRPIVGRAVAYADIDSDGDLDLLFTQVAGPPVLLRNDQQLGHHYLRFQLIGAGANRHAVGARIEVLLHDQVIERCVMPARGYLSQVELPVTIGLAKAASVDRVSVIWPNGVKQNVIDWKLNAVTVVRQSDPGK